MTQVGAAAKPNLGPLPETPGAVIAAERPLPPPPGEELYESLADLKAKGATGNRDKTLPRMSDNALSFSESDFAFVKVLGRGSFGKVRVCGECIRALVNCTPLQNFRFHSLRMIIHSFISLNHKFNVRLLLFSFILTWPHLWQPSARGVTYL